MTPRVPVVKAHFTPQTGANRKPIPVHFNPVSLQYSVRNTIKEEREGKKTKQYVTQAQGKLTMELIFDNTHNGEDVRLSTVKIAALMQPDPHSAGAKKQVPSIVLFEWGAYKFQGMMESYKETLDFFAPAGVPLRSSVNVTLVEQDQIFDAKNAGKAETSGTLRPDAVDVPGGADSDPSSVASASGDPGAARLLGALNASESLRFSAGASLTVTGSVSLGAPAAFASGADAGSGVAAGFGSSASAGVSASQGAFAGLRVSGAPATAALDTDLLLPVSESVGVSTGAGTDFAAGGQAGSTGAAGLSADVGGEVDLRARIQFEVE